MGDGVQNRGTGHLSIFHGNGDVCCPGRFDYPAVITMVSGSLVADFSKVSSSLPAAVISA